MSFMRGDLLTKTRKLVKGLAKAKPLWLKAMEEAPPVTFPHTDGKVEKISLPEDIYIKKFFRKHPDSKYEDAIRFSGFDPPPARVFGWRVLELKEQGVSEEEAMAVADMEYRAEKKAKKQAYKRLKQIAPAMEMETPTPISHQQLTKKQEEKTSKALKRSLLVLNCILLAIGTCGGPLLMRLYFLHGGKRIWFSSWLETGGWPVIIFPLLASNFHRRSKGDKDARLFSMNRVVFAACAVIGVLTGLDDYLYAYGVLFLPVSTSALIIATQLAFTAGFAFLLVRQKFSFYSINSVVLLSVGAAVLALHTSSDRPANESNKQYFSGFLMTLAASALYGLVLPLVELTYKKARQAITYSLVMEMQMVMALFATGFCTIGMLVNKDFEAIPREARNYGLGETKYYVVIAWSAIVWQCFFLGAVGVIFCGSSLLAAIIIAVLLPVTEILAVIFYHESFKAEKGVALALSLWGFTSYFFGELKASKKNNQTPQPESNGSLSQA